MRIPVGLDLSETWEIDLCLEAKRYEIEILERVAARAREDEAAAGEGPERRLAALKVQASATRVTEATAELAAYVAGSGPRFVIGHIPSTKRAEIAGMMSDASRCPTDRERSPAEHAWRREVVRWSVRGHANLRTARGLEVPFDSEAVSLAGEQLKIPTEKQLERYGTFLADLANVAMVPQRLPDAEKNG